MRLLVFAFFVAVSTGCGGVDCPRFVMHDRIAPPLMVEGVETDLEFSFTPDTGCSAASLAPSIDLRGPDGTQLATTVDTFTNSPAILSPFASTVIQRVRFTPPAAGNLRALGYGHPDIEPLEVWVTVFRPSGAEWTVDTLLEDVTCTRLGRTTHGTVLCDEQVFVDGNAAQTILGSWTVSGNVVWSLDGDRLSRWVDVDGSGLSMDPPVTLTLSSLPEAVALLAAETDVIIVGTDEVLRAELGAGGLVESDRLSLAESFVPAGGARFVDEAIFWGPNAATASQLERCRVPLDSPSLATGVECEPWSSGFVVDGVPSEAMSRAGDFDGERVWLEERSTGLFADQLHLTAFTAAGADGTRAHLPQGYFFENGIGRTDTGGAFVVPSAGGGGFELPAKLPDGYLPKGRVGDLVWATHPQVKRTAIFRR